MMERVVPVFASTVAILLAGGVAMVAATEPALPGKNGKTAYTINDVSGEDSEIKIMNADGSGEKFLTDNRADDHGPAWSPDGSRIAFQGIREGDCLDEIYVMDAVPESAANQPRQLTNNAVFDFAPDWQPIP